MKKKKIDVSGANESQLDNNPFGQLASAGLPDFVSIPTPAKQGNAPRLGRVDVKREKAGRGGKEVTVITGETLAGYHDLQGLAKELRNRCGTGGTLKGAQIELQGDKRNEAKEILEKKGFRVVFTGG